MQRGPKGPTITVERAVHFLGPDEARIILAPGVYGVEAENEKFINVTPVDGGKTRAIQAEAGTHGEKLSTPEAVTLTEEESLFHLVLLVPGGMTLDAVGTFIEVSTSAPMSLGEFALLRWERPWSSLVIRPRPSIANWNCRPGSGTLHENGSITADETWTAAGSPHFVKYETRISATVTVEPCAVVKINDHETITIKPGGALIADGIPGSAVTIERKNPGVPWRFIVIRGGTLSSSHAVVRGGGYPVGFNTAIVGMLHMESGGGTLHVDDVEIAGSESQGVFISGEVGFDATSRNLRIHDSVGYPITADARAIGSIPPGAYAANTRAAIAIDTVVTVRQSQTIHDRGVPYHVGSGTHSFGWMNVSSEDYVNIPPTVAVLTIEPGVRMEFQPGGALDVQVSRTSTDALGALIAIGTPAKPIVFTSDRGRASAAGDWYGIGFGGGLIDPRSTMQHVRVEFAGRQGSGGSNSCPYPNGVPPNNAAIQIDGAPPSRFITNTEILFSAGHGIDRGWRANHQPDFLPTNNFTAVHPPYCKQTMPKTKNGGCPMPSAVPCP